MTAFEVMGEHWFVTLSLGTLFGSVAFRALALVGERMQHQSRRRESAQRAQEDHDLTVALTKSYDRVYGLGEDNPDRPREMALQHRIEIALGWRSDPVPRNLVDPETFTRARVQSIAPQGQSPFDILPHVLVSPAPERGDETSVDSQARLSPRSAGSQTEGRNEAGDHDRTRRRALRVAG